MKLFTKTVLVAALATASLGALAERPNFNYLEGGYLRHRIDNGCVQDGLKIAGSAEISDRVFVAGSYSDVSDDNKAPPKCGSSMLRAGAGLYGDFSDAASFYGTLSGVQFTPDGGDSDTGWAIEGGFRSFITNEVEIGALVGLHDVGPVNEAYISVNGIYWFSDQLGAYIEASASDESTKGLGLGIRLSF
ncbi:MAG TPA: hypothetical protein PKD17_01960 [Cellvibrionaceae bacterium]|nr:hypothetical protein [Cellvibrionaceae bacterium]HMW70552.1 hypothetical protein [Cellvibrionaceae bacterium]HMY38574.1 hypothetical protein [Marinagarivorans sp.]HNG59839.1 hypothetical protein [Cellvibrionaceae bacterium]